LANFHSQSFPLFFLIHIRRISYSAVHKRVRYGLEGKLKVPRPVHSKQELGAPEAFKKADATQPEFNSGWKAHQAN